MKVDKYYNTDSTSSAEEQHEHTTEHVHSSLGGMNLGAKFDAIIENKWFFIGIAIIIIAINILMRVGLLQYQGLFEPDGFFYYSVIRAEINAHFHIVNYLGISGFPAHNFIGEAPGLPYLTVIGYWLLHGITGISALTIMRWMPIFFGVLYAILAYFLAQYLTKSKALGLLAMLFVSISSGNIARTAGTVYRGDSFITFFILIALLLMLKCFEERKKLYKYILAALSTIALGLGIVIWNGSPFIIVVYMLALLFAILYGFIFADENVLFSSMVLSFALLLTNILQRILVAVGAGRAGLQLAGNSFFVLYIPILLGSIFTYSLIKYRHKISLANTPKGRTIILGIAAVVAVIVMVAIFGNLLTAIASPLAPTSASGAIIANNATKQAITATTQELQPPTYNFLWSSFNLQLYLSVIGVILFVVFVYLINKNNRFIKRDHFNLNHVGFLVLLAYFLITAYLQASAIRFNAIISMPLAIFAAFAVYGIGKLFYHSNIRRKGVAVAAVGIIAVFVVAILLLLYPDLFSQFGAVTASIIFLYIALIGLLAYSVYALTKGHIQMKYVVLGVVLTILVFNFFNTYFESYTAVQADGINPSFLSAMSWMKNNTPTNATVLALWPDGSVVEGWANRTSYMDSVGGENGTKIYPFSVFLFNTTPDGKYLYSVHKPEYLVARNFWYEELGGIAQEGLVQNASEYGYVILNSLNSTSNGTAEFFTFSTNQYPYYRSELISSAGLNGTTDYRAFLGVQNSSQLTLLRNLIFVNSTNGQYSIIPIGNTNNSANYSLMVSFTGHEVNGAYILGPKLIDSNVFKFTFLCNSVTCAYNTSNVTMRMVYMNADTRIYKITYGNTTT
jgi:asparagine N-glycosylation enzyme membrane subunit Stt3